jgi:hypothetical protein
MQFEGRSVFDLAAGKVDPQTAINSRDIATNTAGIQDNSQAISTNRIRILNAEEDIIANQPVQAEIYAQPTTEGQFSQQQWNPLPNDTDSILYIEGMGQQLLQIGTVKSYGYSTKPSVLSLLQATGTQAGFNGMQFVFDSSKSVQVQFQSRLFINATQIITRATVWVRLIYVNSAGLIIGDTSLFKQNSSNGTANIVTNTNSNFQIDLKLAPAGTVFVRVVPYINVRCNTTPANIQTSLLTDLDTNDKTRLFVAIRQVK